jgi:plastocyanin
MRWLGGVLVAAVGAMAFAVSPALGADQSVTATASSQFSPVEVTLTQGETVTWTNAGGFHNVVFDDGSFTQPPGADPSPWTVSRTFDAPGAFRYYCIAHGLPGGLGMSGTVVVNQAAPAGGSGSPAGGTSQPGSSQPVSGQAVPAACVSKRRFRIRIREPRGTRIRSAKVSVNGRSVAVTRRAVGGRLRHTAEVDLRGLGRGTYDVDIVAVTDKGNRLRGKRTYRTCAEKLETAGLPEL